MTAANGKSPARSEANAPSGPQARARTRRPSGPVAREQMRAGQRLRLALAMIDAVGQDGYRETRVADVIARAGVSRKTFYELFD
ncbi:MAG: TetR family transcriptional regulator, partial [Solirubrobacteraceae bacterium]